MKKYLVLITLFLTACATYEKYANYLNSFIGMDKATLISIWGVPDNSYQLDKDTEYLTWKQSETTYIPGRSHTNFYGNYAYTTHSPGYNVTSWCDTTFIIQNNKVFNWQTKGDDCVKY